MLTINDRDIFGANESPDTDGQIERSLSPDWKKFSHPDLNQSQLHEYNKEVENMYVKLETRS